jgi:hypothetical protein
MEKENEHSEIIGQAETEGSWEIEMEQDQDDIA